jgi:hypothetical protein
MGYWGEDFSIAVSILIVTTFSLLYYFRKRIFSFEYEKSDFDLFVNKLEEYLSLNHSKISFDYSIIDKSKLEQNPTTRAYIVINNLVEQFINHKINIASYIAPITQDKLWSSYTFNSKPVGNKLPSDWAKRKTLILRREKNICQRCGVYIKPENSHLSLVKSVENGGQYYIENLLILCRDCNKIHTNQSLKYLNIKEQLDSFVP